MPEAVPVAIRGIYYPSQSAAAKALGVRQDTIHHALERGTLEKVGLGEFHVHKVRIMANGNWYPSISEAAKTYRHDPMIVAQKRRKYAAKGIDSMEFKGVIYEW